MPEHKALECSVRAIGLIGPGLPDWTSARAVLRGEADWEEAPITAAKPTLLPANERRRATPLTKLALATAQQALEAADIDPVDTPTVFATRGGDLEIAQKICQALTLPERPVSPMVFHNSVHNATAGYYSIGSGSRCASTSITAGEGTAAAGLIEAAVTALTEGHPTLLMVYDVVPKEPLGVTTGISADLAVALLLDPAADSGLRLSLHSDPQSTEDCSPCPGELAALADSNPTTQLLPLLQLLATDSEGEVILPQRAAGRLRIHVSHRD